MEKQSESTWTRIFHANWFVYVLISPLFLVLFAYVVYPSIKLSSKALLAMKHSCTIRNF